MSWKRGIRPASFRGAGFHVEDAANEGGRRNQVHEYYGRDEPFTEEYGRRARRYHVRGYLVGDDYMARRDALVAACERAGAGTLVHPYLGEQRVVCDFVGWSERKEEGRYCVIDMTFVEAGTGDAPTATLNAESQIEAAALAASAAALSGFRSVINR